MKKCMLVVSLLLGGGVQANVCTNTFKYSAANTPDTAYEWNAVTNWNDQTLGVPDGGNANATLPAASAAYFVRSGATVPTLSKFSFGQRTFYLGDIFSVTYTNVAANSEGWSHNGLISGSLDSGSYIFGNLYQQQFSASTKGCYFHGFQFAGHFYPGKTPDGTTVSWSYAHTGMIVQRMDLFADDTNPIRTESYHYNGDFIENGGYTLVGPRGADAHSSAWNLQEGSVYLKYAGNGTHAVVPGVTVSGTGIDAGTFVKYVFAKTGWIALSKPATATGTAVTLDFGAITPSVSQYWRKYWQHTGGRHIRVVKYRPQDGCTFVVNNVYMSDGGSSSSISYWGLEKEMLDAGYLPGDIVISNLTSGANLKYRQNRLETVNIRFANNISDTAMSKLTASTFNWSMPVSTAVAHLAVDAEKTANLYNLKDVQGTLYKDGAGTLLCRVADTCLAGQIKVTEGTLQIARTTETDGATIVISNLTLSAGARLQLPADGLTVVKLTVESGATIVGPGTLTITGTLKGVPSVSGGATVNVALASLTRENCVAPYKPWINLDASATDTITYYTEGGTNFVRKIMDASGSGEYAKPYMGDSTQNMGWVVPNATNGMPFIDLGPFTTTNGNKVGVMKDPDRALRLYGTNDVAYYGGYEASVAANAPRKPVIYEAFMTINSAHGGGSILGSSGHSYFGFGLPHGRNFLRAGESAVPIHCFENPSYETNNRSMTSADYINNGSTIFHVNGETKYPQTDGYSGNYDVITLYHVNGFKSSEFGHFYQGGAPNYENSANGFAFGEYLLFTNKLSVAAIETIEAYLAQKWYGRRTAGYFADGEDVCVAANSTLSVSGSDGVLYASSIGGAGTIDGAVKLSEAGGVTVAVAAGSVVDTLTVSGTLTLPTAGRVTLTNAHALKAGVYTLVSATTLSGSVADWTVAGGRSGWQYALGIEGDTVRLTVVSPGVGIFIR